MFNSLADLAAAESRLREARLARQRYQDELIFALIPLLCVAIAVFLGYWGWSQIVAAGRRFSEALGTADEARAKAEEANRAKDKFLSMVSHELRNPLNALVAWSAALRADRTLPEKTLRGLAAIDGAIKTQTQLIDDLLDLAGIESGRLRLNLQRLDLAELVEASINNMRVAAEAKSIAIEPILEPRLPSITGDPARLQQIVWNLLANAIKFTPTGGRIQVRVERKDKQVEIAVADMGQGIAPASLPFVFDRFWQADASSQSQRGLGLGLSIVKEIVSLHGGTVIAHSDGLGLGSTFTVRLPTAVPMAASDLGRPPRVDPIAT